MLKMLYAAQIAPVCTVCCLESVLGSMMSWKSVCTMKTLAPTFDKSADFWRKWSTFDKNRRFSEYLHVCRSWSQSFGLHQCAVLIAIFGCSLQILQLVFIAKHAICPIAGQVPHGRRTQCRCAAMHRNQASKLSSKLSLKLIHCQNIVASFAKAFMQANWGKAARKPIYSRFSDGLLTLGEFRDALFVRDTACYTGTPPRSNWTP